MARTSQSSVAIKAQKLLKKIDRSVTHVIKHVKRFILNRIEHVKPVRRFVVGWISLLILLISFGVMQGVWYNYQTSQLVPVEGGSYAEGIVDKITTLSPFHARSDSERALSHMVYPGLIRYDSHNKLTGDLAAYWSADTTGKQWTVTLRPNLKWTDGTPLTSDDVLFTTELLKNEAISQSLSESWRTIKVEKVSNETIKFILKNPLTSFKAALDFGIVPKHLLAQQDPKNIANIFAHSPDKIVGSGLFKLDRIENNKNGTTWKFKPVGTPHYRTTKLASFSVRTYETASDLVKGFKRGEVNAVSNLGVADIAKLNPTTENLAQIKTADGVFAIFNNAGMATSDPAVRKALRAGLNRTEIIGQIAKQAKLPHAPHILNSPIATNVLPEIDKLKQPDYNAKEAARILDQAGWQIPIGQKYRKRADQLLEINFVTIEGANYANIIEPIAEAWRKLGVKVNVVMAQPKLAQQNFLVPRNYDVLLYQLHLGGDPDMFAYWASSQASKTGLNLANYTSKRADLNLIAGRTNADHKLSAARYLAFAEQWIDDAPAIALYQPSLLYVKAPNVTTFSNDESIIDASTRFNNIDSWTTRTKRMMKTP